MFEIGTKTLKGISGDFLYYQDSEQQVRNSLVGFARFVVSFRFAPNLTCLLTSQASKSAWVQVDGKLDSLAKGYS